jgi:hypothetical protein
LAGMQEVPQSARQFEYHQMKLLQQRQILNSWRGTQSRPNPSLPTKSLVTGKYQ